MIKKNKNIVRPTVPAVPADKSKFKFSISLEGEWDWNNDFVRQHPGDLSLMDEYYFQRESDFQEALKKYLTSRIDHALFNGNICLTSLTASSEVIEAFKSAHEAVLLKQNEALKAEVEQVKKQLADLQFKLTRAE